MSWVKHAEIVQASDWIGKVLPQFEGGENTDVFRVHGGPNDRMSKGWKGSYSTYGDVLVDSEDNLPWINYAGKDTSPLVKGLIARTNKGLGVSKTTDSIFSYGCNRLGWCKPEMYDNLYGGRLKKVTMVPDGLGSPLAGISNGAGFVNVQNKVMSLLGSDYGGQLKRQEIFEKGPEGSWESTGYHKGFLDTTKGKMIAGGGVAAASLLAWLALRDGDDEDKEEQT